MGDVALILVIKYCGVLIRISVVVEQRVVDSGVFWMIVVTLGG